MAVETPPTNVSNEELVRWTFDRINERDVEALKQVWTEATVERFPDRTCHGATEIASYFTGVFAAIPDWHMEIMGIAAQNDDVFVHWHLSGTHSGSLFGIEATGKRVEADGMDHFVLREGKVVSNFVVFDQMQFARGIGMLPADGSAPDRAMKAAFNARTKLLDRLHR
jgi:predicted ester cyclase